jgi:hypothetical protein
LECGTEEHNSMHTCRYYKKTHGNKTTTNTLDKINTRNPKKEKKRKEP